ncbi:MAG: DUF1697 domain-containing protein [Gammaproteobacteria bacterium]|nr:DUF1697 domain-containing protein [Gammaproteobacteria bacterium]
MAKKHTWIALFRGVNVGGKHIVPMQELRQLFTELGLNEARTYIQSGNVVFRTASQDRDRLAADVTKAVDERYGFEPKVLLMEVEALAAAIARNPYPRAESSPKSLHLYFFYQDPPNPDIAGLNEWKSATEHFTLIDRVLYLHAPDGIGRSKLAERIEKLVGVGATARNWRSTTKILAMAKDLAG